VGGSTRVPDLRWVFRPSGSRPAALQALAGRPVHAVGAVGSDGGVDVVLQDGTRVCATPAEVVAGVAPQV